MRTFYFKYRYWMLWIVVCACLCVGSCKTTSGARQLSPEETYDGYVQFFEEVYATMQENYYKELQREDFDRFVEKFHDKIFSQLKDTGKSDNFIRWRSAAFLIEQLRDPEDVFSAFYPPEPAKEYEQTALGIRIDLGVEGELGETGFLVKHVEPRSDAFEQGLRPNDIILSIAQEDVLALTQDRVTELLNPLKDSTTQIVYLDHETDQNKTIGVLSKEYFKQTVFPCEVERPGVLCLQIQRFNRTTSEDLLRYLGLIMHNGQALGLILDLRGNPGGPPLAAREIASFFLPNGTDFTYFQQKDEIKGRLDIPTIPEQFHYDGPIVILINEGSGSAAELFSGTMQKRGRAVLMGVNSAGQVMLKSMFHFDDGSMALLVTARGHHPDGSVFSFGGIIPDRRIEGEDEELIDFAAKYLYYVNINGIKLDWI